jgi:Leucine-rich repeat (LRR) protein
VTELFLNIPPTLENCDFSNNNIWVTLPKEFPIKQVLFLVMSNNNIAGPLPDFPNTTPKLKRLKLANNHITGTIHDDMFKLGDLSVLDLAGNKLSGGIPASIGDLTQLSTLKLSSNSLGQSIPVKLGKLKGTCCLPIAYVLTSQSETKSNVAYTFVTQLWLHFCILQTCWKT